MSEGYISDISVAVAQKIVKDYFQTLMGNRASAILFYAPDAVLVWDGNEYQGHEEIQEFFNNMEASTTFQIAGFDVQSVPNTDVLTMVIIWGSYNEARSKMATFYSTMSIEANAEEAKALIKYHNFSSN